MRKKVILNWIIKTPLLVALIIIIMGLSYFYLIPVPSNTAEFQLFTSDLKSCSKPSSQTNKNTRLVVSSEPSAFDDIVSISVKGLTPSQIGTLKLTVTDSEGVLWESIACFEADQYGEISPETQSPLKGSTYSGTHAMGLFWSLKPEKLTSFSDQSDLTFVIGFQTAKSEILYDTIVRKTYLNLERQNILKKEIRGKVIGNFYSHLDKTKRPTIVLLAGSDGNFQHRKSCYLASKGFNVLDLKYFGAEGLSERLEGVPLEYLKNAIDRLKKYPSVDTSKIALMGRSKGAEYALLYASKYNNIYALVSMVGSHVAWSSKSYFSSSWTYKGEKVSYSRGTLLEAVKYLKKSRGTAQNQLPYMLSAFEKEKRMEQSSIQIENIKCPILLLSGESDLQWPSSIMSDQIVARAKANNFQYEIEHYSYENAGHQFDELPFTPQVDFSSLTTWRSGGDFQGNALASIHSWNEIFTFLNEHSDVNKINE